VGRFGLVVAGMGLAAVGVLVLLFPAAATSTFGGNASLNLSQATCSSWFGQGYNSVGQCWGGALFYGAWVAIVFGAGMVFLGLWRHD
jgi:hypothetical protein